MGAARVSGEERAPPVERSEPLGDRIFQLLLFDRLGCGGGRSFGAGGYLALLGGIRDNIVEHDISANRDPQGQNESVFEKPAHATPRPLAAPHNPE